MSLCTRLVDQIKYWLSFISPHPIYRGRSILDTPLESGDTIVLNDSDPHIQFYDLRTELKGFEITEITVIGPSRTFTVMQSETGLVFDIDEQAFKQLFKKITVPIHAYPHGA